ncbi:hypothetical protein [Nonomuraea dietziae]|uniref:hypothetical protein n=1 Tax=Nonomuraea dietziae TaxID=65515 RepID=UPI0034410F10
MRSEGDPNPTVRIRRPQPGQVSQPLPVQPGPPVPPAQSTPSGPMPPGPPVQPPRQPVHPGGAEELGSGTVRLPYSPDDLPPVVYAPPPQARWRWAVVAVVLAALLLAALIFGVISLNSGALQ